MNKQSITPEPASKQLSAADSICLDIRLTRSDFTLNVQQTLPLTGITGIFGHSGSGKSSLLRIIAGLDDSAKGKISLGSNIIADSDNKHFLACEKRDIGLIFQDSRLFPHLSVEDNLRYALKRRAKSKKSLANALSLEQVVASTGLSPLLHKQPSQLSGGEQQRVALARAILAMPKLLLLDEPFSALDESRKAELLTLLAALNQEFAIPMLFVSHAIEELQQVADNLLVLAQGQVKLFGNIHQVINQLSAQQSLQPAELENTDQQHYHTPAITSLALPIKQHLPQYGLTELNLSEQQSIYLPLLNTLDRLNTPNSPVPVPVPVPQASIQNQQEQSANKTVACLIYASDISITLSAPHHSSIVNKLCGTIKTIDIKQHLVLLTVECESQCFFVNITLWSYQQLALAIKQTVYIQFKAGAVRTLNNSHLS